MKTAELLKWRKKHRYTQSALGKLLGVTKTTVYRWEKGMREMPAFLHLALRCLELEGGESKKKGRQIRKRKEVKR